MKNLWEHMKRFYPKPDVYVPSTSAFWDDEYISKELLKAHLNPNMEAASRHPIFIEACALFIRSLVQENKKPRLLDLGCGPGLYAEAFVKQGFSVEGVDFSKRSIAYAMEQTKKNHSNITYRYQNYLTIDFKLQFDVVTLIYCDYAVLSPSDRKILLNNIHDSLLPQGIFIFDVFTHHQYPDEKESSSWYFQEGEGFWRESSHLVLERHHMYYDHIRCDEHIVIDDHENIECYRIWDQSFDQAMIEKELIDAGFSKVQFYSDVKGSPFSNDSKTMGIVATK